MMDNDNEFIRAVLDAAAGDDIDQLVKAITTYPQLIDEPNPNHWKKDTPMHVAAGRGTVLAIEALVRLGSNAIDTPTTNDGWTPLYAAAANGHAGVMETLVGLGSKAIPSKYGCTPLFAAATGGHVSAVETLVRLGSNAIDTPDKYGSTPLDAAVWHGDAKKTLVALGATPLDKQPNSIPTEDEVAEVRHRVYFAHSLVHRLLSSPPPIPNKRSLF